MMIYNIYNDVAEFVCSCIPVRIIKIISTTNASATAAREHSIPEENQMSITQAIVRRKVSQMATEYCAPNCWNWNIFTK